MICNFFSFDFNVILHILKTFLTPRISLNARQKISDIKVLVEKSQNPKHIELLESIKTSIEESFDKTLNVDSIRRALAMYGDESEEEIVTTTSPKFPEDHPAVTHLTDTTTQVSITEDEALEDNSVEATEGVRSTPAKPHTTTPGNSSSRNKDALFYILVMVVICVMR
uniref:Uncharacterized protein n=1 Tax=Graphocephala atropunctata TaxID=36148 RepID=A0A1B6KBR9_9HEMI